MNRYEGIACPICNEPFSAEADIVVCPACGTPHHRACVQKTGVCAHADKHAEGYHFELPQRETDAKAETEHTDKVKCANCGYTNDKSRLYCDACGVPLVQDKETRAQGGFVNAPFIGVSFIPQQPADPTEEVDGVSVKELSTYVGENASYFVPRFKDMKAGGKRYSRINFCAFFFEYWYFIYRKMWGFAALSFVTSLLMTIPNMLLTMYQLELTLFDFEPTLLMQIYSVAYFIFMLVRVTLAVCCNRVYMNTAFKKIKRIKASSESEEIYSRDLIRAGGVSRTAVLIFGAVYLSAVFAATMLLSAGVV